MEDRKTKLGRKLCAYSDEWRDVMETVDDMEHAMAFGIEIVKGKKRHDTGHAPVVVGWLIVT